MSTPYQTTVKPILYPDSDGLPMSDNTLQFQYIVTIKEGLEARFQGRADVFVAGDLLWYAVEGRPDIRSAPDTLVVFGRPKGYRGSYRQWEEGGIAPQVVFEIWSQGNHPADFLRKFNFYQDYGVEEYYFYDPDRGILDGWRRVDSALQQIPEMDGWVSPRLGVRFELFGTELRLFYPDGQRFATYLELYEQRERARKEAAEATQQAELERLAREQAQQRAEHEHQRAEAAEKRAEQLAAELRARGIEPPQ